MVVLQKQKITSLQNATAEDIARMRQLAYPMSSSQYPSIIRLWYDTSNSSKIVLFDNFFLALLSPLDEPAFWTISGKALSGADTAQLLQYCQVNDISKLSLVPAELIEGTSQVGEIAKQVESDENDSEYIYDVKEQARCEGHKFVDMRYETRRFFNIYGKNTKLYTSSDYHALKENDIKHLFDGWLHFGTDGSSKPKAEKQALENFLNPSDNKFFGDILITEVMYKDALVGFSINELLGDGYAINHFHKANLNLTGISYYLFYSMIDALDKKGVRYLNLQEDCGIEGLRLFKRKMRPSHISKNYELFLK